MTIRKECCQKQPNINGGKIANIKTTMNMYNSHNKENCVDINTVWKSVPRKLILAVKVSPYQYSMPKSLKEID